MESKPPKHTFQIWREDYLKGATLNECQYEWALLAADRLNAVGLITNQTWMEMVRLANAALINGDKSKWSDKRLCENVRYVKVVLGWIRANQKGLTAMKIEFIYNPSNPYLVVKDGVEIGAMIDNVLYRFD